jgi:hypothetical protein
LDFDRFDLCRLGLAFSASGWSASSLGRSAEADAAS